MTHEVVAGLLVRHGQVLLCHRSADRRWFPDVWDLPGGHVAPGEAPTKALVREIEEELGVVIEEPTILESFRLTTTEFDMRIWILREWTGMPRNASPDEHDDVAWFDVDGLDDLSLGDESYPLLIAQALGDCTGSQI